MAEPCDVQDDPMIAVLNEWMRRPDWLRGAAAVRVACALEHPDHSEERRVQMKKASFIEGGGITWAPDEAA